MRTDTQRATKYDAKTIPASVAAIVAAVLPGMRLNFRDPFGSMDLVEKEQQTQGLLNAAGTPTIQYPLYLDFVRLVWRLSNAGIAGQSLATIAAGKIGRAHV